MNEELFGLSGKGALVVGGGLGMGKETADLLSRVGASVAVLDVVEDRAREVAEAITSRGGRAVPIAANALDGAQAAGVIEQAAQAFGDLHIMVNIVGMAAYAELIEMTDEIFEADLQRNLRYQFWWCRAFARFLEARQHGGAIVNIASVSGLRSAPLHAAYGAAKAGLMSLSRTMAVEWAPRGIRVNCVAPGTVWTDRSQGTTRSNAIMDAAIPVGHRGHQTDIAGAVLFLASDLAGYITGQTLLVDGALMSTFPLTEAMRGRERRG